MKRKAITAALACLLLVGATAWAAPATQTPVAGVWDNEVYGPPPERMWIDEDGIQHIRGYWGGFDVIGDLNGTAGGVFNLNLDPLGNGDAAGTLVQEVEWDGLTGTFEGRFSVTYTNWWSEGQVVAHGTGDFEGMKLMVDFTGWLFLGVRDWNGVILDTNAE